ncbi:hypothetical protein [Candidatus Avelusimicrobium sp.]|uniref:hypothetical protein n=1 Tax=Candidatus Avelusimicrobium sp. TaxID=3048833 RepID=UPI003D7C37FC
MKNKFLFMLTAFLLVPAFLQAQVMVVRVDGNKVYLDTSSLNRNVQKGDLFKVILSSEKLTNPKTGKDLGLLYHYSQEGKIVEVQPLYAVGETEADKRIAVGQEVVLTAVAPAQQELPAATQETAKTSTHRKTVYEPVEQEVIGVTEANVTGENNFVTLSNKGQVTVWTRGDKSTLKEEMAFTLPNGKRALAVSAAPVKDNKAQIFVSYFDEKRQSIFTTVLENQDGALKEIANLSYFAKELGCGKSKQIWLQKPFVSGIYPGNARLLAYTDGKFAPTQETISTYRNWLTGLNHYAVETATAQNTVYTSSNGRLRLVMANGKRAESKDLFAGAPNRVKYKQEILKFYPSVQVFGPEGNAAFAAVESVSKLGILSDTFGQYQNSKIHFLTFEKGRLSVTDTVELDGVVYDTACTDSAVLAAEVLPDGNSSVVEIFK